jgi:hypothetical protein
MTDPRLLLTAVASTLSLLGIWLLYCWFYRDYRVDLFRQRLFKLRDSLFDYAESGQVSFDHPAYGMLRSTLNGFIRFGHRFGFLQILIFVFRIRADDLEAAGEMGFQAKWTTLTRDLPAPVREKLNGMLIEMHVIVTDQLVFTSPILLATLVPVVSWAVLFVLLKTMRESIVRRLKTSPLYRPYRAFRSRLIDPVDSAALEAGEFA